MPFIIILIVGLLAGTFAKSTLASECFQNLGPQESFGSSEQVSALKVLTKTKCTVIGITASVSTPVKRSTLIVVDFEAAKMFRLKLERSSWVSWSGFTRKQILEDDPSDGFDLPGFYGSRGSEVPTLTKNIKAFITRHSR